MFHLNTLEYGGAERVVSNLANVLCKGDDEIIISTAWTGDEEFALESEVKRIHVGLKKGDETKDRFTKVYLRNKYLREAIKSEKPDVVIAFTKKPIYRALTACIGIKTKLIVCVRIDPVAFYSGLVNKLMIGLFNWRADGAVFQTADQRDFFPKHLRDISTIIMNPVASKYHLEAKDIKTKNKTIVQHARIVDFKNQALLIDAFMKVHKVYPEYDLKIYGSDSMDGTMDVLNKKISDCGATDYIKLMGNSNEIEKVVPECALYVMSSDYEGMPNSMIEAMAMGMPVVATDCPPGACRILMTNMQDGILVPIKDEDAMAEGIIKMIENPDFANTCAENAVKVYDKVNLDTIVLQWKKYIEKVISDGK